MKGAFVSVFNDIYEHRDSIVERVSENIRQVNQHNPTEAELEQVTAEIDGLKSKMKALACLRISNGIDVEVYNEELEQLQSKLNELRGQRSELENRSVEVNSQV